MDLKDYYDSLDESSFPKKEFRDTIIAECDIDITTFYRWLKQGIYDKLKREKVSQITGIPELNLKPKQDECQD